MNKGIYVASWFTTLTTIQGCGADAPTSPLDAGTSFDASTLPDSASAPDASSDAATPAPSGPVKALTWNAEEGVTTADLTLAYNNTAVAARDKNEGLHLVWAESQKTVRYGYLAKGATTWKLRDVPRTGTGGIAKPTLSISGTNVIVVWNETGPNGVVVGNATSDFGATWSTAIQISDGPGESASLIANEGTFGASVAWIDSASRRLKVRALSGSGWSTSALKAVQTIDAKATKPSGDPQIFGHAPSLFLTWDNGEEGSSHDVHIAQSSDGEHFGNERLIGVTQPSRELNSGNDASGCAEGSSVFVAYQDGNGIYIARSTDGGKTFEPKGKIGDGLFAHLECLSDQAVAVGWEFFTGNNLKNDAVKTVGNAYTLDGWNTVSGPHAISGSDKAMGRIKGTLSHSDKFLDYWWVENPGASAKLGHRSATIVRE